MLFVKLFPRFITFRTYLHFSPLSPQKLNLLSSIYSMSPPDGGLWDNIDAALDMLTCVCMPDGLTVQLSLRKHQTAGEILCAACKVGFQINDMSPEWVNNISDRWGEKKWTEAVNLTV